MSYTNQTKNASSFSALSKNTSSFSNQQKSLLNDMVLMESGSYLLQENLDKLILEQTVLSITWNTLTKN